MPEEEDSSMVKYTVKDLLDRQDKKLDRILEQLPLKANISDFIPLEARVRVLENDHLISLHDSEEFRKLQTTVGILDDNITLIRGKLDVLDKSATSAAGLAMNNKKIKIAVIAMIVTSILSFISIMLYAINIVITIAKG